MNTLPPTTSTPQDPKSPEVKTTVTVVMSTPEKGKFFFILFSLHGISRQMPVATCTQLTQTCLTTFTVGSAPPTSGRPKPMMYKALTEGDAEKTLNLNEDCDVEVLDAMTPPNSGSANTAAVTPTKRPPKRNLLPNDESGPVLSSSLLLVAQSPKQLEKLQALAGKSCCPPLVCYWPYQHGVIFVCAADGNIDASRDVASIRRHLEAEGRWPLKKAKTSEQEESEASTSDEQTITDPTAPSATTAVRSSSTYSRHGAGSAYQGSVGQGAAPRSNGPPGNHVVYINMLLQILQLFFLLFM